MGFRRAVSMHLDYCGNFNERQLLNIKDYLKDKFKMKNSAIFLRTTQKLYDQVNAKKEKTSSEVTNFAYTKKGLLKEAKKKIN